MMEDNNKNKDQQNEMDIQKEEAFEHESEAEGRLELSTEEAGEILMELAINPELELSEEAQAELLRLMKADPELVRQHELFKMAKTSGYALANKDNILGAIRDHVKKVREQFPGYAELDWMTIFSDLEQTQKRTIVMEDRIQIDGNKDLAWIRMGEEKAFRKVKPNERPEDSGEDYLVVKCRKDRMYAWYYSNGQFYEEPALLLQKDGDPEEDACSVLFNAGRRTDMTKGMMPYTGTCEELEAGTYKIQFLTNYKKLDENGSIICE